MDKLIEVINQEIEKSNLKLAVIEGNKFNKGYTGAKYLHVGAIEAYEKVLSIIEGGFDNHDVLPSIIIAEQSEATVCQCDMKGYQRSISETKINQCMDCKLPIRQTG